MITRILAAGVLMLAWYFAVVDPNNKRVVFGPYQTENECTAKRNIEVLTDRWVSASACESR